MVEVLEAQNVRCKKNEKGLYDCEIQTKAGMRQEYVDLQGLTMKDKATGELKQMGENGMSEFNPDGSVDGAVTRFFPEEKRLVVEV